MRRHQPAGCSIVHHTHLHPLLGLSDKHFGNVPAHFIALYLEELEVNMMPGSLHVRLQVV